MWTQQTSWHVSWSKAMALQEIVGTVSATSISQSSRCTPVCVLLNDVRMAYWSFVWLQKRPCIFFYGLTFETIQYLSLRTGCVRWRDLEEHPRLHQSTSFGRWKSWYFQASATLLQDQTSIFSCSHVPSPHVPHFLHHFNRWCLARCPIAVRKAHIHATNPLTAFPFSKVKAASRLLRPRMPVLSREAAKQRMRRERNLTLCIIAEIRF